MAVKEWFRKLQPVQLYLILFLTTAFFIVEIVSSYITHSLTLLLNAYHMLCNIIALVGCIASIKYTKMDHTSSRNSKMNSSRNSETCINTNDNGSIMSLRNKAMESQSEQRMKNTFGWARIDILTMLVCCVFLASFCFSLLVEALQTLVHIDHLHEIHHALSVMCIGASGILLNAFCYIIIGGYTFNQGVFLHITAGGEVVLKRSINSRDKNNDTQTTNQNNNLLKLPKTQGLLGMCRDVLGCVLVMVASIVVYFTESSVAKFVDPIFAIISAISLLLLSLPYMKESGLILLQTIPNHINIDSLKKEILETFPGIVNVHDLHIWQLTEQKVISTVHIIFLDPAVYASIIDALKAFFIEMGITQVTIQPEFHKMNCKALKSDCLIPCQGGKCHISQCCLKDNAPEATQLENKRDSLCESTSTLSKSQTITATEISKNLNVNEQLRLSTNISEVNETSLSPTDSNTNLQTYAVVVEVNERMKTDLA